jgi:hypothetical protein
MGETERSCKKPACCSLSLAIRASVSKSLLRLLELVPDLPKSGDQFASKIYPPKVCRKTHSILFRDPLRSRRGAVFAPPVRARSAARASPRLLGIASSGCLPSCLRRGTTRSRLWPVYPSCLHLLGDGVPTRGTSHWGHPLRVERTSWPDASSFWPLVKIHSSTSSAHIYTCMCTSFW